MRLIDADFVVYAAESEFPEEDASKIRWLISHIPTVETYHNFDIDVNAIFDRVTGKCDLKFGETDEMCPICQRDLEVYYCENRTYIVRCKHCHIVTLVQARNPYEAAEKVGLHVKPVRHGTWEEPYPNDIWDCYQCSGCGYTTDRPTNYCPSCGTKMDAEVRGDA